MQQPLLKNNKKIRQKTDALRKITLRSFTDEELEVLEILAKKAQANKNV